MGAIAEAIVAYAKPLLDESGGTKEGINRAMALAQVCWNLALFPEDQRDATINKMKSSLSMTDEEFADFREHVVLPMIRRHWAMFPAMHERSMQRSTRTSNAAGVVPSPANRYPGTGRNAPCPCGSGRKYKRCCGAHQ